MARARDFHNFDDQFRYQLEKLDEADIDDRNREAKGVHPLPGIHHGLVASTNVNNCSDLRLGAERAETLLTAIGFETPSK